MERGPTREVAQNEVGAEVLLFYPRLRGGIIGLLEPAVRVSDLDAVKDVDGVVAMRRGRRRNRGDVSPGRRWACGRDSPACVDR